MRGWSIIRRVNLRLFSGAALIAAVNSVCAVGTFVDSRVSEEPLRASRYYLAMSWVLQSLGYCALYNGITNTTTYVRTSLRWVCFSFSDLKIVASGKEKLIPRFLCLSFSLCLSVCLSCLSVCLSVCLPLSLSLSVSVSLSLSLWVSFFSVFMCL